MTSSCWCFCCCFDFGIEINMSVDFVFYDFMRRTKIFGGCFLECKSRQARTLFGSKMLLKCDQLWLKYRNDIKVTTCFPPLLYLKTELPARKNYPRGRLFLWFSDMGINCNILGVTTLRADTITYLLDMSPLTKWLQNQTLTKYSTKFIRTVTSCHTKHFIHISS